MAKDTKDTGKDVKGVSAKETVATLQPEDRIRRLKQLEGEKKKEIAEMEKLIKESETEITEKRKFEEKVPIPQVAQENMAGLSEEGKQLLSTLRDIHSSKLDYKPASNASSIQSKRSSTKKENEDESGSLEQTVSRSSVRDLPHPAMAQYWLENQHAPAPFDLGYVSHLKQIPAADLYREMAVIGELVLQKGYATAGELRRAEHIAGAMEEKLRDIDRGKYSSFSEDVAKAALVTQSLGLKIRDVYKHATSFVGHDYYQGN